MSYSPTNFDPNAFLDMPVDVAFERRPPLPVKAYTAIIEELIPRQWQSDKKFNTDGTPKSGVAYDLILSIQIPLDVKDQLGLKIDTLKVKDGILLDMNEQGGLDSAPGANRQLRMYREALDMNKPGVTFRARDMAGRMLLVQIKHEEYPQGSGNMQEKVASVAKL
jgi:signal transduction protein with GAF and PtsI domain